jgi:hypothetical protein
VKEQIGRSMEQNRCSEIVPYKYTQLIFDKEKKQYNGEKTVFSPNGNLFYYLINSTYLSGMTRKKGRRGEGRGGTVRKGKEGNEGKDEKRN